MINPYRAQIFSLYRDILRTTRSFLWYDNEGNVWRDVLRKNARKEFDEKKNEKNLTEIQKFVNVGRESVDMTKKMIQDLQNKQK